jgi:hypothetical protein
MGILVSVRIKSNNYLLIEPRLTWTLWTVNVLPLFLQDLMNAGYLASIWSIRLKYTLMWPPPVIMSACGVNLGSRMMDKIVYKVNKTDIPHNYYSQFYCPSYKQVQLIHSFHNCGDSSLFHVEWTSVGNLEYVYHTWKWKNLNHNRKALRYLCIWWRTRVYNLTQPMSQN